MVARCCRSIASSADALFEIFEDRAKAKAPAGSVVVLSVPSLSGHSADMSFLSWRYCNAIAEVDPKLGDRSYVDQLYRNAGRAPPANPKLGWGFRYLDLGLVDHNQQVFVPYCVAPHWLG